jgi:hypothetical protein
VAPNVPIYVEKKGEEVKCNAETVVNLDKIYPFQLFRDCYLLCSDLEDNI